MEKIFIIWEDYDGVYVEEFDPAEKDKAERKCASIMADKHEYCTKVHAVIQGKMLKKKTIKVKVVSKIELI